MSEGRRWCYACTHRRVCYLWAECSRRHPPLPDDTHVQPWLTGIATLYAEHCAEFVEANSDE